MQIPLGTLSNIVPAVAPVSFSRQLEPHPRATSLSPIQLLQLGLAAEFPSIHDTPTLAGSQIQPPPSQPQMQDIPPLLHYIGVGEANLPRGCKWGACAGAVIQIPDHAHLLNPQNIGRNRGGIMGNSTATGIRAESGQIPKQAPDLNYNQSTREAPIPFNPSTDPTPVYIFKSHALQMVQRSVAAAALPRVDWTGHGFKLLGIQAEPTAPGPLAATLRCEQPESLAAIVAVVVHLYPLLPDRTLNIKYNESSDPSQSQDGAGAGSSGGRGRGIPQITHPRLPERYEGALIRGAIDSALSNLKQQCPGVMSDRRERSLGRALPVVSNAVANILLRSMGEGVLEEACTALGAEPHTLMAKLQLVLEETVTAQERGTVSSASE